MPTYCQVEEALANARGDVIQARKCHDAGGALVVQADNNIGQLGTTYADVVAEIETQATADPTDEAWGVLKSRKDKIVAEASALRAETAAAVLAFAKIVSHGGAAVTAKLNELA